MIIQDMISRANQRADATGDCEALVVLVQRMADQAGDTPAAHQQAIQQVRPSHQQYVWDRLGW